MSDTQAGKRPIRPIGRVVAPPPRNNRPGVSIAKPQSDDNVKAEEQTSVASPASAPNVSKTPVRAVGRPPVIGRPPVRAPQAAAPVAVQQPVNAAQQPDKPSAVRNIVRPVSISRNIAARPPLARPPARQAAAQSPPPTPKNDPPKSRRRSSQFNAGDVSEIRTPEEQEAFRDSRLNDTARSGYRRADEAIRENGKQYIDCPFLPDAPGTSFQYNWEDLGGPPPGIAVQSISDEAADKAMDIMVPKRDYEDPPLPSSPPPPKGSSYNEFLEWTFSDWPPEEMDFSVMDSTTSSESLLALDLFIGRRNDIYRHYQPQYAIRVDENKRVSLGNEFTP